MNETTGTPDPLAGSRDKVLMGLRRNLMHSGYGHEGAHQRAQELLDAYTHQLAEQIRADATERWAPNSIGNYAPGAEDAREGQMRGADLIDPEAQQ